VVSDVALRPGPEFFKRHREFGISQIVNWVVQLNREKVSDSINIPIDRININLTRIVQMNRPIIICSNSDSENERVIDVLKANGVREIYNGGNWTKMWRMMRSL